LFQGKLVTENDEQKPLSNNTRKGPTLKYSAKKPISTDQQDQRAKTVDIVRLKTG